MDWFVLLLPTLRSTVTRITRSGMWDITKPHIPHLEDRSLPQLALTTCLTTEPLKFHGELNCYPLIISCPVSCTTPPTVQSGEQDDTKSLSWPGSCHERTERAGRQEGDFYSSPTVIIQDLIREIYLKEILIEESWAMRMLWVVWLVGGSHAKQGQHSCKSWHSTSLKTTCLLSWRNSLLDAMIWWEERGMLSCHHSLEWGDSTSPSSELWSGAKSWTMKIFVSVSSMRAEIGPTCNALSICPHQSQGEKIKSWILQLVVNGLVAFIRLSSPTSNIELTIVTRCFGLSSPGISNNFLLQKLSIVRDGAIDDNK